MTALRIAYVIGTTAGGTGRHVAMLAEGCAGRDLTVSAFGPDATRRLFPAVAFTAVDIGERPRRAPGLSGTRQSRCWRAAAR